MKLLILICLFWSSIGYTNISNQIHYCDLKLPKYIIYGNKPIDQINFAIDMEAMSNCNEKKIQNITRTIKSINGEIPFNYLSKLYRAKGVNLISEHKSIHVVSFNTFLQKHLAKATGDSIQSVKHSLTALKIFTDKIKIYEIEKNNRVGSLSFTSFSTKNSKTVSFNFDYKISKELLTANHDLYPYSSKLKAKVNLIRQRHDIWKSEESKFVDKINHIDAYKLVKILKKGKPIQLNDIKLRNVISTGKIVPVVLRDNGLLIKTIGISRNSGKIGDLIEVKLKNNKIVSGIINIGKEYYVKI